ncbi:CLUMA_CG017607, isoform A [Clunio marinus]|uniref:CLUMA_CG017607, isoform A n=1 Tax=Clunio marinus TaxID=568069 RepID=A0A1J1IY97_9DIPT|nr:CLUMA_CG017607, isoform A [Clunio marinus]
MAEVATSGNLQRYRSMNEREPLRDVIHDYKQYIDLRNSIVTDYDIKYNLNNNNNNHISDNRNISASANNNSSGLLDPIHQSYSSPSTPSTPLSITDAQMNDAKIFGGKSEHQLQHQQHMRETKPYKCTQCTKSFANSSYLSQHTRIHLGIKPYRCEICQRKFTQLSHLQQHIRTHTGDKPYKCRNPGCVKAFSQLSNLQSHSRCHATDKPYKCNACYKCFTDETTLLEHIPKHKESKHLKTHICQYCGKSYTQETYLAKHLQKHIERAEKRSSSGLNGLAITSRNVMPNTTPLEHPYWPKVSPDSATENMQQQSQYDFVLSQQQNHNSNTSDHIQGHHRTALEHHRINGNNNANGSEDAVEDLVVIRQNPSHHHITTVSQASQPNNQQIGSVPVSSVGTLVVTTSSAYDSASKPTSNSAFTPINVMPTHLNTLQHHQLAQRPLYYDAIAFQNKNIPQNNSNGFPNQLISLHQIRNYAHQPASGLISGEHLIGIGVSVGKDKGQ